MFQSEMLGALSPEQRIRFTPPEAQAAMQVLLVQRRHDEPRWISNLERLRDALHRQHSLAVRVQVMDGLSLFDQFALVSASNVLLGAHGAGLSWLVAMAV